jgi:hypothetical protein
MENITLTLIIIVHTLFVLFVLLTPFIGSNYFLLTHTIILPFIMVHWLMNDNSCFLTFLEQKIRSKIYGTPINLNECFTSKLIHPIYDFKASNEQFTIAIYLITAVLWFISVGKLLYRYKNGQINTVTDLLKIN